MKKTAAAASALALGALAAPAHADAPGGSHNWTGPFLGAGAGLTDLEAKWGIDGGGGFNNPKGSAETSNDVGAFMAQGGYNYQFGPVVVGGIADYAATRAHDTTRFDGGEGAELRTRVKNVGTFRGRVGFAMDNVLLYATGGVALSDLRNTYDSNGSPATTHSDRMVGWIAGGGVEIAVDDRVSFMVETTYAGFHGRGLARGPFYNDKFRVDTKLLFARFGVNFHF